MCGPLDWPYAMPVAVEGQGPLHPTKGSTASLKRFWRNFAYCVFSSILTNINTFSGLKIGKNCKTIADMTIKEVQ